jgi:hypothetical protein
MPVLVCQAPSKQLFKGAMPIFLVWLGVKPLHPPRVEGPAHVGQTHGTVPTVQGGASQADTDIFGMVSTNQICLVFLTNKLAAPFLGTQAP